MKKSILVTAVAGSGKSTVCKALNDAGFNALDIEDIPGLFSLLDEDTGKPMPSHDGSDVNLVKRGDWVCDKAKLKEIIDKETATLTFYCGASSNYSEIWNLFDQVIFLKVSDKTTLERLSTRKLGEFGNSQGVREWVLSWKKWLEDEWLDAGAIAVSGEESPKEVANVIIAASSP